MRAGILNSGDCLMVMIDQTRRPAMQIPEPRKRLKFLLLPILLLPAGVIVIAMVPTHAEREAATAVPAEPVASAPPEPIPVVSDVVGVNRDGANSVELHDAHSAGCDMMFRGAYDQHKWQAAVIKNDSDGSTINGCWRQYDSYEETWDFTHHAKITIALCPLIDGLKRYQGCQTLNRDIFDSQ
jgi:hypothetical protein